VTQSERFDAEGKFIRCYVPELTHVNAKHIHAPWLMSADEQQRSGCVMGRDYPGSVVEHAKAREVALALFKKDK
jgi:deoxyribodipyrimidine photo-lyase